MTLKFLEGYEVSNTITHYNRKWAAYIGTGGFAFAGRLHGSSARATVGNNEWRTRSLGLQDTWVIGFGLRHVSATVLDNTLTFPWVIKRGTAEQIRFQWRKGTGNTFNIEVFRGITSLGVTSDFVALSWHYFEFKFTIDPVNGSFEIRHNTIVDLTDAGPVNTADSGLAGADVFEQNQQSPPNMEWDDLYILDDQGTINNDYLGDSVIEGRIPTGDAAPNDFTPSGAGNNFDQVDEDFANIDWIFSSTIGHQDLFSFNALSFVTGTVHGVMLASSVRLDTTGSREFKHVIRSNGTLFTSPAGGITHTVASTVFQVFFDVFERDPDTAVKWTIAGVDAADFGVEVVS